jgi:hypothetical protein
VLICCVLIQNIHQLPNIIHGREDKWPSPAIQDISKNSEFMGSNREEPVSFVQDAQKIFLLISFRSMVIFSHRFCME